MNKKLISIICALAVVLGVAGYVALRDTESSHSVTQKDEETGKRMYTNLDYGFSIVYGNEWDGPAETKELKVKGDPLAINAIFSSSSTLEAIVIGAKPGDTETFNEAAAILDIPYTVTTIGGLPSLRYEYVTPINEEASAYAKTVIMVFKGLPKGSVTMAYQKLFNTEAEAKKADMSGLNNFLAGVAFK